MVLLRSTTATGVLASTLSIVTALNVSIPLSVPSSAPTLSPSFVSLSIEQDRWLDWAGTSEPNQFFYNTFNNLRQITGAPPGIRIGADSEDHTDFGYDVQGAEDIFPAPSSTTPYPEAASITVGYEYYQAVQHLLPGTHVIWGVNFGQDNITAAFLEAQAIMKAFSSDPVKEAGIVLDNIEIGNEADLYLDNGDRPSTYNVSQYITEWIEFATNISESAGLSEHSYTKYVGGAFAGSTDDGSGFSAQALYNAGLLDTAAGKLINTFSQHHYSGSFCAGTGAILQDLITKSYIRGNISAFSPDVEATHAQGLRYVFGETNSFSCHGTPGVSNTAGASLWALDYLLFASQIGIEQVFFHDGIGFKYNLIQPITLNRSIIDASPLATPLPPHIQPQYYAAVIAAEAIGKETTRAAELTVDNAQVSGYGFYEGSQLKRAIFINLDAYLSTSDVARTNVSLSLGFSGGAAPKNVIVKRLGIQYADDTSGVTWGGQTYETADGLIAGKLNVTTVSASEPIELSATEVVLLTFE